MSVPFIQAKWYTKTNGRRIDLGVVHQMQAPDKPTAAEACARYFQTTKNRVSAHRCFDSDSEVQCVKDKDIAYSAPGANHNGLHYELAGYSQNATWGQPSMESMMWLCARRAAMDAHTYRWPLLFRTYHDLRAGGDRARGITTHKEVSEAWHRTDHWDPGPHFPISHFMDLVRRAYQQLYGGVPPTGGGSAFPSHLTETEYGGKLMQLSPHAGVGTITSAEAGLPGNGEYNMTADGGIQAGAETHIPSEGVWNYMGLAPEQRMGERFGTNISANLDGSPGYTQWFNDGSKYSFGPGKNGWPG